MEDRKFELDHLDIVTCHLCNKNCEHCIDKFLHSTSKLITLEDIEKFLDMVRAYTDKYLEVLLLGGEPTILPKDLLIEITDLIHDKNFLAIMSTNGILKQKVIDLIPFFDSIQVTINSDEEVDYYRNWTDKINIKLAGDSTLDMDKLRHFIEYTKGFDRRSVSMYFTPDFKELCNDEEVWKLLDKLDWKRNGSYLYSFYEGVRFKRCIKGETNIIDEPTVPKLYPNGNYNRTWNNEELDDYLSINGSSWTKKISR